MFKEIQRMRKTYETEEVRSKGLMSECWNELAVFRAKKPKDTDDG